MITDAPVAGEPARDAGKGLRVLFFSEPFWPEIGGVEVLTDPRQERTRQFLSRVLSAG